MVQASQAARCRWPPDSKLPGQGCQEDMFGSALRSMFGSGISSVAASTCEADKSIQLLRQLCEVVVNLRILGRLQKRFGVSCKGPGLSTWNKTQRATERDLLRRMCPELLQAATGCGLDGNFISDVVIPHLQVLHGLGLTGIKQSRMSSII